MTRTTEARISLNGLNLLSSTTTPLYGGWTTIGFTASTFHLATTWKRPCFHRLPN